MEDFYELELNIKGLNTLEESLNDYFSEEALDGENQYFCGSCQKRVDATRCIKLHSLPPVVNFHLKRYVFLPKVIFLSHSFLLSFILSCPRILSNIFY
jgi:ubiquitin carboxyl-terminal hydrolase 48